MQFIKRRWDSWSRAQRIGWSLVAGFVAIMLIGSLGSLGSDGEEATEDTPTVTETVTETIETETSETSVSRTEPSAVIAVWADDVTVWAETMSEAFSTLGELLTDERFTTRLLLGDPDATLEVALPLATMRACSASFPRAPSDVRAQRIQRTVTQACRNFKESASLFARGVDNSNVDSLLRASQKMTQGTAYLERATAQTEALTG